MTFESTTCKIIRIFIPTTIHDTFSFSDMTTKLLLKVSLLSLIFCVNGQFKHFPVQAGRPDSPTRQQPQAARPKPAPALGDVEDNEVIPAPVARSRGRGRSRGAQRVQDTPQRVQETPQRSQRVQETPQRPQRVQETPQRPQRGRVPERSREVPQTTNLR